MDNENRKIDLCGLSDIDAAKVEIIVDKAKRGIPVYAEECSVFDKCLADEYENGATTGIASAGIAACLVGIGLIAWPHVKKLAINLFRK